MGGIDVVSSLVTKGVKMHGLSFGSHRIYGATSCGIIAKTKVESFRPRLLF
jgi:hypothetical protein